MNSLRAISFCALVVMAGGPGRTSASRETPLPFPQDPVLEDLIQRERYAEALDHAVAALRLRAERQGPMAIETLVALEQVGQAACRAGELAIGEAALLAVFEAYREALGGNDPRLAPALMVLGRIAWAKRQPDRELSLYQEAKRLLDGAGPAWERVRVAMDQAEGSRLRREGRMAEAVLLYRRSLDRLRNAFSANRFDELETLTWIGWMLSRMGRFEEAEPYLLEAKRGLRSLGFTQHRLNGVIANVLAERLALQGRWKESEPFYRQVAETFTASRGEVTPGFARRIRPLDGFAELAFIALREGRSDEAWVTLQRSRAAVHMDFARLATWRDRDPEGFSRAAGLRSELLSLRRDLTRLDPTGMPAWTVESWRTLLRSIEIRSRLRSLEAEFLRAHPVPEASLQSVRELLGPKTAMLGTLEVAPAGVEFSDGPRSLHPEGWLYVVRGTGPVAWVPLPAPLEADAPRLRQAWRRLYRAAFWPLHVDDDPEIKADQRAWAIRYFDPVLPYLEGVEHLIIEGHLQPYETMTAPDGRLVGESYDISYVPSAQVASLLAGRRRGERKRDLRSILSISAGAPREAAGDVTRYAMTAEARRELRRPRRSFLRSETSLDALPLLPFAAAEASLVASKFPKATVLQGPAGVELRLRELAEGGSLMAFDVVHIAGHSLSDGNPERAGLALAEREAAGPARDDGILDVEEILLGWSLDADLLTLSGCETALAGGAERGENLGFTPALLSAGARTILSSLWPVDDRATALLMDRFYDNITGRRGAPMSFAGGLRDAKSWLRGLEDDRGRKRFEHPAYWAGFILTGLPEEPSASARWHPSSGNGPSR